jgi:hypothetical protein
MSAVLGGLLDDPALAAVVAVVGSSAQFYPERAVKPMMGFADHTTPLAGFMVPQADLSLSALAEADMAGFRTPETCADAIRALMNWTPLDPPADLPALDLALPDSSAVDELAALALFEQVGVSVVASIVLNADEPIPDNLAYPLVAKVLSSDIAHKTEAGGVVLNIANAAELAAARTRILANVAAHAPDARIHGILLQPQRRGIAEALIGLTRDSSVGAIITLAAGGTLAEIYQDSATRLAPVTLAQAHEMIGQVRGLAVVRGYRGLPKGDVDALAENLVAVSRLANLKDGVVDEAEINPVIILGEGEGVVAVDGLLRLAE